MKNKIIINFTPTGMIPTKAMTPHVPISPKEIVDDVLECAKLGAGIIHLHARDKNGEPTYDKEVYKKIILAIREKNPSLILTASCSGRNFPEFEYRKQVLELDKDAKPDMASLTLSSINFSNSASISSPDTIIKLAEKMRENEIKPELEVFDFGMLNYAHYLINKGILAPPYYFNIILGNVSSAQAKLDHLGMLLREIPKESIVTVGGIGKNQLRMNTAGLLFANGARVGLEDYIFLDEKRKHLATNYQLVKRVADLIDIYGFEISSAKEIRQLLSLKGVH